MPVSKMLGVSGMLKILPFGRTKLLQLLASGEIPAAKIGRKWFISEYDLNHWYERQKRKQRNSRC